MIRLGWVIGALLLAGLCDRPSVVIAQQMIDEDEITDFDRDHWAYDPVVRPRVPRIPSSDWPQTEIDAFILSRLASQSLQPAARAEKTTLIRRIFWDLTGLPPTVDQVSQFVDDPRPDAYQRVVDSLLASPEYGTRWAQFWLDLARFAETDGYEHDKIRSDAWKFRDWVIAAMNDDFPYDDFVRWQIAGDQIDPSNPKANLATAFCLSGPDMPDINLVEERRHVLLNEITSTVGSVMMSLQFGCAQCHDHKYDSISQADFYRLRAFFDASIELKKNESVSVLTALTDAPPSRVMLRGDWRRRGPTVEAAFPRVLNPSDDAPDEEAGLRRSLADWLTSNSHPLTARVIVNRVWQQHFGKGLSTTPSDFGVMSDSPTHPRLLDYLADQLMQDDWSLKRLHRMIVMSSTYQTQSTRPSDESQRRHWDQALAVDPANRLLSHYPRRRLSAEAIRDGLFAVSGSLNHEMGGPGVSPPLPTEMIKTLKSGQWKQTPRVADHYRRSVYIFARRNLRYPFFATFDRPSADQPCSRRDRSTTAVQSLMLLNSDLTWDAASRLAAVVAKQSSNPQKQVDLLYQRLYARACKSDENEAAVAFLSSDATLVDLCRAMLNANEFVYVD
jgi:hypothetical protein